MTVSLNYDIEPIVHCHPSSQLAKLVAKFNVTHKVVMTHPATRDILCHVFRHDVVILTGNLLLHEWDNTDTIWVQSPWNHYVYYISDPDLFESRIVEYKLLN